MTDYERDEPTRPCARGDDDMTPPLPMRAVERGLLERAGVVPRERPYLWFVLLMVFAALCVDVVLRASR